MNCMPADTMGAVGEQDVVQAFGAMGMKAIPAETKEAVAAAVFSLAEQGVPVIFITERAAELSPETMDRYRASSDTVLVPIPGSMGTNGYGMRRVRANIEKAIGADILFGKEG